MILVSGIILLGSMALASTWGKGAVRMCTCLVGFYCCSRDVHRIDGQIDRYPERSMSGDEDRMYMNSR